MKRIGAMCGLFLALCLFFGVQQAHAATWTQQTGSGARNWIDITSSADGTKLAAAVWGGYIYISTDSGVTWTAQTAAGSRYWRGIASSADGMRLVAAPDGGYIYTSVDGGITWIARTGSGSTYWQDVVSSSDGMKLAAVAVLDSYNNCRLYTSSDGGATWVSRLSTGHSAYLRQLWSSTDGTKIIAPGTNGYYGGTASVFVSSDSGVTWTTRSIPGMMLVRSATASDSFSYIFVPATPYSGQSGTFRSTNSGATWTSAYSQAFSGIASTPNGSQVVGTSFGNVFTSTDYGATWTQVTVTSGGNLQNITSSTDGTKLATYVQGGYIYTTNAQPATCSVSLSPNPINQGQTSTLTWTSANANTWVYIENVGYVSSEGSPSSGSFSVSPSSTTDYSCTAQGSGGTSSSSASLTVYQSCSLPWGGTTAHNTSITAYQASTVPYGSSCTSQSRTCTNGTLSGSYQYQSCTVDQPASCTLDGVTVPDGSSHTFYSQTLPPAGTSCSAYSQSRTCTNGTLSGSSSYQYASCTCNPTYSCTNATTLHSSCPEPGTDTACLAGYSCSGGACVALDAAASPFGTHSGHLQAYPTILRREDTTTLYWNTVNTQPDSCTVRGNGQTWYGPFSGTTGTTTNPLTQTTTFTLSCTGVSGVPFTERATVNTTPMWMEQ